MYKQALFMNAVKNVKQIIKFKRCNYCNKEVINVILVNSNYMCNKCYKETYPSETFFLV